ncbi:acyl-CoA dehydrogenase [Xenophilus arseniciresistens]|uniref:Acyl-CoA dehydrogenase n=1 Tax=Xenophilus arseniciresistens TaxID=1283306 RepID=A0AAE3N9Q4_9BURK|nr:acyl-CoA dehydrogenase [Xenophilus arseniciresistens]MDA7418255.1 acyl-CoA dehydrogenase [Xenophilus arseniciresistens]
MDLQYTPEQTQLRESVERFVREAYDFAHRRKLVTSERGHDEGCWRQYAEFGWLAIPFSEEDGGIGGDATDTGIVMEGVGRGLLLEPYLASVVLGGGMLAALGSAAQKAQWLQPMMGGERKLALAYAEPASRYEITHCEATARREGDAYVIDGAKTLVYGGPAADAFVVIARTSGAVGDRAGLSAFVVDAGTPGLALTPYATHDGQRAADLTLQGVRVDAGRRLGEEGGAAEALERVIDQGIAALASEAVGAMAVLVDSTLEYLKTRQQFGRPIGTNQALQHRMVDMYIALDEARSMALYGALMLRDEDTAARRKALSATKIEIDRTARRVGQEAVQMHGAMGVTEELAVGHYFKRLSMIATTFGDSDWHVERYMAS